MAKPKYKDTKTSSTLDLAFESGNYFALQTEAKALLQNASASEADKSHARDLLNKIKNDPLALLAGALSVVVALVMALLSIN
jgi:hypothetical protein